MTALEIRLIAYALLALILLGGAGWVGHRLTARHYEALIAANKAAQDEALQEAQRDVIAAQAAQAQALQRAEKDHEALVESDTTARNAVLGSVRNLETALRLGPVSGSVDHPGQSVGTAASPPGADELGNLVASLNERIAEATAACQHDSSELAGILEIAPH